MTEVKILYFYVSHWIKKIYWRRYLIKNPRNYIRVIKLSFIEFTGQKFHNVQKCYSPLDKCIFCDWQLLYKINNCFDIFDCYQCFDIILLLHQLSFCIIFCSYNFPFSVYFPGKITKIYIFGKYTFLLLLMAICTQISSFFLA